MSENTRTPAPVSSPAGEDVERVAREALVEAAFGQIAAEEMLTVLPTEFGAQVPSHWREKAEERARPYIAVLAALSARPVEAQEVERLPDMGQEWPSEEARLRYVVGELQRAAAAALARAEAAEALLQNAGAALNVAMAHLDGRITERDEEALGGARFVLDDLDAALSAQPVAQEGEEEWALQGRTFTDGPWDRIEPMSKDTALVGLAIDAENRRRGFPADRRLVRRTVTPWVPVETGGEGK